MRHKLSTNAALVYCAMAAVLAGVSMSALSLSRGMPLNAVWFVDTIIVAGRVFSILAIGVYVAMASQKRRSPRFGIEILSLCILTLVLWGMLRRPAYDSNSNPGNFQEVARIVRPLAHSLQSYSRDHSGHFPDKIETLLERGYITSLELSHFYISKAGESVSIPGIRHDRYQLDYYGGNSIGIGGERDVIAVVRMIHLKASRYRVTIYNTGAMDIIQED